MALTADTIDMLELKAEHEAGEHHDADVIDCPICASERAALNLGHVFGENR